MKTKLMILIASLLITTKAFALSPVEGIGCFKEGGATSCISSVIVCDPSASINQILYGESVATLCQEKATEAKTLKHTIAKQRKMIRELKRKSNRT